MVELNEITSYDLFGSGYSTVEVEQLPLFASDEDDNFSVFLLLRLFRGVLNSSNDLFASLVVALGFEAIVFINLSLFASGMAFSISQAVLPA